MTTLLEQVRENCKNINYQDNEVKMDWVLDDKNFMVCRFETRNTSDALEIIRLIASQLQIHTGEMEGTEITSKQDNGLFSSCSVKVILSSKDLKHSADKLLVSLAKNAPKPIRPKKEIEPPKEPETEHACVIL